MCGGADGRRARLAERGVGARERRGGQRARQAHRPARAVGRRPLYSARIVDMNKTDIFDVHDSPYIKTIDYATLNDLFTVHATSPDGGCMFYALAGSFWDMYDKMIPGIEIRNAVNARRLAIFDEYVKDPVNFRTNQETCIFKDIKNLNPQGFNVSVPSQVREIYTPYREMSAFDDMAKAVNIKKDAKITDIGELSGAANDTPAGTYDHFFYKMNKPATWGDIADIITSTIVTGCNIIILSKGVGSDAGKFLIQRFMLNSKNTVPLYIIHNGVDHYSYLRPKVRPDDSTPNTKPYPGDFDTNLPGTYTTQINLDASGNFMSGGSAPLGDGRRRAVPWA
jgi:hypothetical protein